MREPRGLDVAAGIDTDQTETTGRCLEAIVWYYEAVGDPVALSVAERIAANHLTKSTNPDGTVPEEILRPTNIGHCHSYLGTLRGLLLFGFLTGEREYIDTVSATYRRGLPESIITESGWSPHDLGMIRYPNEDGDAAGEPAGCGDAMQIALWLALRDGQTDLFDDVERWMRTRILPGQILAIGEAGTPRHQRLVPAGMVGGWGAYGPPYSFGASILDIFAAVLHTQIDVYENILSRDEKGLSVNLHFDVEREGARLTVHRRERATVILRPSLHEDLRLRVPTWTPPASVRIAIDNDPVQAVKDGHYLTVRAADYAIGSELVLSYDLPRRVTSETMPVSHKEVRLHWRGDDVIGIDPHDPEHSLYPPWSG